MSSPSKKTMARSSSSSKGSRNNSAESNVTSFTDNCKDVKVVTVGESAVGKSSLTLRFVHNHFKENQVATIGASFLSKTIYVNKQYVKFHIWDTAGQEKYRSLASLYYRGVDCAIVVYDISNRNTFTAVKEYWMNELTTQCSDYGGLLIVLAGNKCDLVDKREVSEDEGRELAEEFGAMFFECSAKTDSMINEIFVALANDLPETTRSMSMASTQTTVYKVHVPQRRNTNCC